MAPAKKKSAQKILWDWFRKKEKELYNLKGLDTEVIPYENTKGIQDKITILKGEISIGLDEDQNPSFEFKIASHTFYRICDYFYEDLMQTMSDNGLPLIHEKQYFTKKSKEHSHLYCYQEVHVWKYWGKWEWDSILIQITPTPGDAAPHLCTAQAENIDYQELGLNFQGSIDRVINNRKCACHTCLNIDKTKLVQKYPKKIKKYQDIKCDTQEDLTLLNESIDFYQKHGIIEEISHRLHKRALFYHYKMKDYERAVQDYIKLTTEHGQGGSFLDSLAREYMLAGQYGLAYRTLNEMYEGTLEEYPALQKKWNKKIQNLNQKNNTEIKKQNWEDLLDQIIWAAADILERRERIALRVSDFTDYFKLANFYLNNDRYEDAIKYYSMIFIHKLEVGYQDAAQTLHQIAHCHTELKQYEDAVLAYDAALTWTKGNKLIDDSLIFTEKAKTLLKLKRKEEAIACLEGCIKKHPEQSQKARKMLQKLTKKK